MPGPDLRAADPSAADRPAARGRRALLVDAGLAVFVGALAAGSARWQDWWDTDGRRDVGPMGRHGGPPFRPVEETDVAATVPWLIGVGVALVVAGLIVRRLTPRVGYLVVVAGTALFLAGGGPYGPVLLGPVLAVLALADRLPLRAWVPWSALLPIMMSAGFWRQPYVGLLDPALWPAALFGSAAIVLPTLFVVLRRSRREADAREREAERDRYVYAERMRIAREVHDVVGHSLSVINLQAGVALHVLDRRPDQVAASLEAIKLSSKDALTELRHTLGMFRDADGPDPIAPQAGLDRLDDLVGPLRAAGREVDVRLSGDVRDGVPAAVDHAAYRIVQEALTNVVRHAGGAAVVVEVSRSADRLRIVVRDDGPSAAPGSLSGNGIRGMGERAAAVGGTLDVRPGAPGGVVVEAELPILSISPPAATEDTTATARP